MNAGRLDAIKARHGDWYGQTGAGVWADLHGEWADMRADTVEQQVMTRQIVRNDVPALVSALRAVLDMHTPIPHGSHASCGECSDDECVAHPCPTVRAITEALGGESP